MSQNNETKLTSKKASLSIGKLSGNIEGNVMSLVIKDECNMVIRGRVSVEDLMLALTGVAEVPFNITYFSRRVSDEE